MNLDFKVFSGTNSQYLAKKICSHLNCELGAMNTTRFSDGEFAVSYEETVRGRYVYLVQSTFPNSDNLMELLLMIDAAKRASAYKIVAVIPYFGWARQDRKDKPRVSIGAKLIADLLSAAGVDRVITMDLHADQIQGFFNVPVDHLYASTIFVPFIKSLHLDNLVIASPDVGGSKRAQTYSKHLAVPLVLCHKTREKANMVSNMSIIGDVKDKNVILVDDIIDTGGTLCKAAKLIKELGAKSVFAMCAHALLSGNGLDNVENSVLEKLIITDTIPLKSTSPKVHVVSVSEFLADVIRSVMENTSISSHYFSS